MEINLKELKEDIADRLFKVNFTDARSILRQTEEELQRIGNFTTDEVKQIFHLAAKIMIQPELVLRESIRITVGCKVVDNVLGGGLKVGGITELSGESGCGKTQFCLRLSLTTQNPVTVGGVNKSVLYICTEDSFPSKRLLQLIDNIQPPFKNSRELSYGDGIYVEHLADVNGLKDCLIQRIPKLLNSGTVGLLIIDSIAAVFRSEYSFSDGNQRTKDLRTIGLQLHSFSRKYNLCILCVNQVSASVENPGTSDVPALGLAWANLVTTRIMMRKYSCPDMRKIEVVFSPHTKPASCHYIINEFGVQGITPSLND